MSEQNAEIEVQGVRVTAAANPILGDMAIFALHVATVYEEYNKFAKLVFTVFDENGTPLFSGNETISGDDYENWDGNDLEYPYTYVGEKRGLTIVKD